MTDDGTQGNKVLERYKGMPSFKGWYIPHETGSKEPHAARRYDREI